MKNNRFTAAIISVALSLSLCACSGGGTSSADPTSKPTEVTDTTSYTLPAEYAKIDTALFNVNNIENAIGSVFYDNLYANIDMVSRLAASGKDITDWETAKTASLELGYTEKQWDELEVYFRGSSKQVNLSHDFTTGAALYWPCVTEGFAKDGDALYFECSESDYPLDIEITFVKPDDTNDYIKMLNVKYFELGVSATGSDSNSDLYRYLSDDCKIYYCVYPHDENDIFFLGVYEAGEYTLVVEVRGYGEESSETSWKKIHDFIEKVGCPVYGIPS